LRKQRIEGILLKVIRMARILREYTVEKNSFNVINVVNVLVAKVIERYIKERTVETNLSNVVNVVNASVYQEV